MGSKFPTPAPTDPEHRKPPAPAVAPAPSDVKGDEPGLKKLPDGARVVIPCPPSQESDFFNPFDRQLIPQGFYKALDPALYGIPDGGEREDAETVEYWSGIVTDKNQRIKELEAKHEAALAQEIRRIKGLTLQTRTQANELERLRKAIGEIRDVIAPHPAALMPRYAVEAYAIAAAALSPSPAAASVEDEPLALIAAERRRQIDSEYWNASHDDQYTNGQLALAAACYAAPISDVADRHWPWARCWNKRRKHNRERQLVIAGALIVAELERLQRQDKRAADALAERAVNPFPGNPPDASGEWVYSQTQGRWVLKEIYPCTSAPAAESDKPYGLVEQMDAGEGTVYGRRVTVKRREEPAAETQGSAQHHSEGAKIPEGGSGSSAAESEGGETEDGPIRRMWEALKDLFGPWSYPNEADVDEAWDRFSHKVIAMRDERDALSARLAACEERCRELEAGIKNHKWTTSANPQPCSHADHALWSLLSPKAGGEDAVV